jgi:hypothetical protein
MDIQENIVNKVAQSGLVTLDPASFYPPGERVIYDIKDNLFHGLMLREKDLRDFIKEHDFTQYEGKNVGITCTADAIVPTWAYMLLANRMAPYAREVVFGDRAVLETVLFEKEIAANPVLKLQLQTQQQLAVQSLSIANSSSESILSLFR